MLSKLIVLIIALILLMVIAGAEIAIIESGDTLTTDLNNGAYILIPGQFQCTNFAVTTGQLQIGINNSNLQLRTNTNKTLTNLIFNTTADNRSFNASGTDGHLNFSVLVNYPSTNYSYYLDNIFQSNISSDGAGLVTVNYTGAWSDHTFSINYTGALPPPNHDNFTFTNAAVYPVSISPGDTSTVSININDSDGYILSATVTIQGINYTLLNTGGDSWAYTYSSTDWSGHHYITHFYATDNSGASNSTTSTLYIDVATSDTPSGSGAYGGVSGSSGSGASWGSSDELDANIACSEKAKLQKLQANKTIEYRPVNSNCLTVLKFTFVPTQNSKEQSILIEKLYNHSSFTYINDDPNVYAYFNIYTGLFGYDAKTKNETVLFKVKRIYLTDNKIDPADITLALFSGTEWIALPTTIQSQDSLYYIYEATDASTYGKYSISTLSQQQRKESVKIITQLIDKIIQLNEDNKFLNNISFLLLILLISSTVILITIHSHLYRYEYTNTAIIISLILITLVTITIHTPLILIPSTTTINTLLSSIIYSTVSILLSYIRRRFKRQTLV